MKVAVGLRRVAAGKRTSGRRAAQIALAQKNLKKFADLTTRVNLAQNLLTTKELTSSVGARLLGINRTSIIIKARLFLKKN